MAKKTHVVGSGNVFADLGHPRPAAKILDVDQPKVSALIRGRLAGFSLDRLVRFLVLLGSDVEIVVKPRPRTDGRRARLMVGMTAK